MMEAGQAVGDQHRADARQHRAKHQHLEADQQESGNRDQRPPADPERIVQIGRDLHQEAQQRARRPADQHGARHPIVGDARALARVRRARGGVRRRRLRPRRSRPRAPPP